MFFSVLQTRVHPVGRRGPGDPTFAWIHCGNYGLAWVGRESILKLNKLKADWVFPGDVLVVSLPRPFSHEPSCLSPSLPPISAHAAFSKLFKD